MWDILKQAFMDTWNSIGWSCGAIFRGIAVPVGVIGLWRYFGNDEKAISEMMDIVMYGVVFLCLAIVPTSLWNLWLSPYRLMEKRLENEINAIRNSTMFAPSDDIEEPQKVDVSDYQNHGNLLLYEAACLWVEIEPHHPIRDQKARAKLSKLKSAIRSRNLKCVWGNTFTQIADLINGNQTRTPSDNQQVSMLNLRRYAEMINDVPSFLWRIQLPPEPSNQSEESVRSTPPTHDK